MLPSISSHLHPSLVNARWRGSHFHSTPRDGEGFPSLSRLFESIGRNEEGRPSPLRLWVLFDATRGETLPVCLTLFDATRRGDPPRRVCSTLFDATRRGDPPRRVCSTLFDTTRRGDPPRRVPLMFFDATRHRTPGVCPFGRTLGVRALSI